MTGRNLPRRFGLTVLAGVLAVFALLSVTPTPGVKAAGASLSHPSVNCPGGANATVAFQWQQISGATAQWLDLSVQDASFAKDTFAGTAVNGATFTWGGLQAGAIHWWRINTNTSAGWQVSATGTFVPCGNPQPLTVNAICADASNANVDFFWAPMAGPNGIQYLDISQNDAFSAGFQGAGPINSGVSSYKWSNLKANQVWYYRVNQRQTDGTWKASPVKSFQTKCGAAGGSSTTAAVSTGTAGAPTSIAPTGPAGSSAAYNPNMYGSNDRLTVPGIGTGSRCSSAAPVNVRDVPSSGQLGDPSNDCDVVRYDFKLFPGYGGYPGEGGATVLAGHVDYSLAHEGGTGAVVAVGQYWKTMKKGDTIQYIRGDGKTISYTVQWSQPVPLGSDFDYSTLARQTSVESLALITCGGTFNAAAHEYDERNVVFSTRS